MKQFFTFLFSVFVLASYSQTLIMPASNTTTTMCSGTFYDSGGNGSTYSSSESRTVTICPGVAGNKVNLLFTMFDVENNYDFMYIYDGPNTSAPSLGVYSGTVTPLGNVQATGTNTSGCITIRFTSDGSLTYNGWAATISCISTCEVINAVFNSSTPAPGAGSIIRVCQGASVTFNGSATFSSGSSVGATYTWNFDNGQTGTGTTASTTYTAPGVYVVNLNINKAGCINNNKINQIVQVSTTPSFVGSTTSTTSICSGQTATLIGSVTPTPFVANCTPPVSGVTFLPDGSGVSYNSCITVDCYTSGQTVASMADINNICLTMEHSYLGDLNIEIICPNGQTVPLKTYAQGGGGTYLGSPIDDVTSGPGTGTAYCFAMSGTTPLVSGSTVTSGSPAGSSIAAGTYSPAGSFSGLVGCPLNGNWCIKVTDNLALDDGYIFGWDVNFNATVPASQSFTPSIVSETWSGANITGTAGNNATIQPTVTGTQCYTLTAVDNFGCSYTTVKCLTVTPSPNAGVSNTLSTCGSTVSVNLYSLLGGGTYTTGIWTTPSGALTGGYLGTFNPVTNAAGNYTYTVPGSGGCPAASAIVAVSIPVTPTASTTGSLSCSTTTVNLSASLAGMNYTWTAPSGGSVTSPNNQATTASGAAGTYSVKVVNPTTGCTYTATTSVTQNITPPTPTASNSTTLTCTTTTAALTGSGGGTYSWSGPSVTAGGTTSSPTVNAPGNYTVTVTAANGCTAAATTSVTQNITPPTPTASNSTTLTCTTTTAALTGSGGGTYAWSGPSITAGGTTSSPTVNAPGNYTVTVTAANGCTAAATTSVTQNITPPTPTASNSTTLTCTTTTAALTGAGGGTYLWTGPSITVGGTTPSPTVNAPGSYTVKVTAANGCTATAITTVTQNITPPTPTATNSTTLTCTTTTAALTGTGGGTYSWSGPSITSGGTTSSPIVNAPGSYTVLVTAANGCTATANTTISQNITPPIPTASNSTTLSCTVTTAPLTGGPASGVTYQWSGPGFTGGTTSQNATGTASGIYTLVVTSTVNNCTASATTAVTQNTTALSPTASNSTTLTCSTITAPLTGGPASGVTYQWSGPGFSGGTTSQNAIATAAGTYTLIVTSTVNSCTALATVAVSQNTTAPIPSASNSTTLTCATTTAALTGTGGGTYAWSGPSITSGGTTSSPIVVAPGSYTVLVTAANGCTATANTTVSQNITPPTPTASNSTTLTCTTTTAALTGTGGGTYAWSGPSITSGGTTSSPIVNVPGSYTVLVTAANGCTATANTTVSQNITPPTPTASNSTTLTCATTTAALTGTGGGTYAWSGPSITSGGTTTSPIVNAPGSYTVLVTAANGCTATASTTVSQNITPPTPTASNSTTLTCATTTAALTGTGGGTYAWSGPSITSGGTTSSPTVNAPGSYSVIVTAANGCTATANTTVSQNITPPTPTASNSTTLTCTTTTAALTGTGGGTYAWSGPSVTAGGTTSSPTVNAPGSYSVIVTAANGCTATANTTVSQNITPPTPIASNSTTLTCTTTTAALTGTGGGTYAWSGPSITAGGTMSSPTVNAPGSYSVIVTAANGCTATANVTVPQNTVTPGVTMPITQTITCASPTVSLIGSSSPSTCTPAWSGGACAGATSFTASACSPNTYTLTVTNPINGCANSGTVSVVPSIGIPVVNASNTGSITCTNLSSQVSASTTMTPVSYAWTGPGVVTGASSSTGTVSVGGTYQCVVTNTLTGCASTITTLVPTNTTPVIASVASTSSITCSTTSLTLNASPVGSYTYSWTAASGLSGTSASTPTITLGGTYSVVITNTVNGCVGSTNITVPSNTTIPTINIAAPSVTTTCANPTITIVATSTPSTGISYSWTSPGTGSLSNSAISNPVASGSGIFTVVVTNTLTGCASSLTQNTVQVTPDLAIPIVILSSNSVSITCSNTTASVSITTTASPVSYSWSPTTGIVSGTGTTSTPSFSLAGSYSAVVTNTVSGCATSITSNVVDVVLDNTVPTISITPSQTLTCTTPSIVVSTTVNPSSGITYNWSGTGVTGLSTSSVNVNQSGVYTTTVTNPINGCTVTANVSIASNTISPIATIAVNSITTTCASPTASLNVSSTPSTAVTYSWVAPASGSLNTYTVSNPVAGGSGIFTVTITDATSGCSSSISQATVEIIPDAATPVVLVSANSLTITCTNTAVTSALTSTNTISSYNWNPLPLTGGANPVFDTPGTYNATVTATNGCPTNVSVNVVLDNTIPTISITPSQTLTCTTPSIVVSTTVNPSTTIVYDWSGSGISGLTTSSVSINQPGIYTTTVTNSVNGCSVTANTSIISNTIAPIAIIAVNSITTTCASPIAILNASSTPSTNVSYSWVAPVSGSLNSYTIASPVASGTGIFTVTVTDTINGCSNAISQATVEVIPDAATPVVLVSANSLTITCTNTTVASVLTSTNTTLSYTWSPAPLLGGANPVFDSAGSYTASMMASNGCSLTATIDVSLNNTIPVVSLSSSVNDGTITCLNPSVLVTPTVTPSSNLSYTWASGSGISSPVNQSNATFISAGVYTLSVTDTISGCVSTTTNTANTFTVYTNTGTPTITVTPVSSNSVIGCSNSIITFTSNVLSSGTALTYTWSNGVNTPTIDITVAGVYSVTVTDSVNGCFASTQFTVDGNTTPPQNVDAGTNASIACGSSSVTLNGVTTSTNVNYSWFGPSAASISSGSNTANPIATEAGTYTLIVTDNLTGCQSTATVNVTQANVTAVFTADPTSGISPLTVNFTDASVGATNWSWNFGDNVNTSLSQNPTNVYTTGSYTIVLTASSGSCTSTATLVVVVEDGLTLEIPNVFTPNGDGVNDVFTIKSTGVKEISLQIFNRWGQKLFEFTGPKASWDGIATNGSNVPDGTYFYFVKATGFDGTEIEKQGPMNLFR